MSAFSPIGSDVDRTLPGQPYVVSSDGWGWFMIIYLLILPFIILSLLISKFSVFFTNHVTLCLLIYFIFSFCFGLYLYNKKVSRHRFLGVISTVITTIPMALIITCYSVPYVLLEPGFDSAFDFVLLLLLLLGGEFLIFSLSRLLKNGIMHLIISIVFLGLGVLLLWFCLNTERDLLSLASIRALYFISD